MLTKSALSSLSFAIKLSCFFKCSPFTWNEQQQALSLDQSRKTKFLFNFTTVFVCWNTIFVSARCLQSVLFLGSTTSEFLLQFAFATQAMLGVVAQLNTYFGRNEMIDFLNKFLQFDMILTERFQRSRIRAKFGILLWSFFPMLSAHYIGCICVFLAQPRTPIFYFSTLDICECWKYAFALVDTLGALYTWLNCLAYINMTLMYVICASFWIQQMCIDDSPGNKLRISLTHQSIRTQANITQVYRCFELLTHRFNGFLNISIMQGQKTLVLILAVVCFYGTIRFYHDLNMIAYIAFPSLALACIIYANVTYPYGRILNADTEAFRRSWRCSRKLTSFDAQDQIPSEHFLRFLLSCRDLKIKMGNFYYYENKTSITFTSKIIEYATTLLLTF